MRISLLCQWGVKRRQHKVFQCFHFKYSPILYIHTFKFLYERRRLLKQMILNVFEYPYQPENITFLKNRYFKKGHSGFMIAWPCIARLAIINLVKSFVETIKKMRWTYPMIIFLSQQSLRYFQSKWLFYQWFSTESEIFLPLETNFTVPLVSSSNKFVLGWN